MLKLNTKRKQKQRRLFFDKDNPGLKKTFKILALVIATSWIYINESIEEQHLSETQGSQNAALSDDQTFKSMFQQELMIQAQNECYETSSSMLRCQPIGTRKDELLNMDQPEFVNTQKVRPQRTWFSRLFLLVSAQEVQPSIIDFSRDQKDSGSSLSSSDTSNQVLTNIETFNTKTQDQRMLQSQQAAQPTIGSNFAVSSSTSNYCATYTVIWTYKWVSGTNDYTDFEILNLNTGLWVYQLNAVLGRSNSNLAIAYSPTLTSYGYYLTRDVNIRFRFRNRDWLYSNYYTGTLVNILKQPPQAPGPMSFSQSMFTFTISWPALADTWVSTSSAIGTGNSPVTYQVQRSTSSAGAYANIPLQAITTGTTFTFSLPDTTNYNYAVTWWYKVGAINSCSPANTYTYSAAVAYTMLGGVPIAPNTPTLSSNFDAILRIDWNQLTTDAEQNYRVVTSYKVYQRLSLSNAPLLLATITNPSTTFWEQWGGKSPLNYLWGSTVYFSVSAVNGHGEGSKSADLAVQMPRVPQVQPSLTLVSKTMTKLDFTWNLITNDIDKGLLSISGYQLEGNTNSLFTGSTILNVNLVSSATSYSFQRAAYTYLANTNYYFRVYAVNQAGFGAMASITTVLTPTVPIKMAAPTVSLINPLNIVVNWVQLTTLPDIGYESITNYYIQRCVGSTCTVMTKSFGFTASQVTFSETFTQAEAIAQQGQVWRYQVFACNFNGNGTASDYLTITVDNVPQLMSTVTLTCVEVLPFTMKFTWTGLAAANDGGDPVTFYGLEYSVGGSAFTQLNSDFSNIYYAYTYSVSVAYIPATVYSFRLKAKNGVDYSNTFATTTCTSLNVPTAMTDLSYGAVNPKSIVVSWNELLDLNLNGRDTPIFYQLEWYNSEVSPARWDILTFQNVHGKVLTYTHTRSTVFPSGSTQLYRVVAQNNMGIGGVSAYSATLSVPTDQIPIRMNNPTLVGVTPNSISLTWSPISLASDTGGDDVIFYHVKWLPTGGGSYQVLSNYPTSTTILTSYTHTLSSGIFASGSPQNYMICAQNGVGEGACGTILVNADLIPQTCNSPTIDIPDIHPQKVTIKWAPIDSALNGGDNVVFYLLEWDQGPTINTFVPLNSYTVGMLVPVQHVHIPPAILTSGAQYKYRVSALNGVGYGPTCEQSMNADLVPQTCSTPDVAIASIKPQQTTVTWPVIDPLQNGGDSVIFYLLEWDQGLGSGSESNFIPLNTYSLGMTVPTSHVHNTPSILNSGLPYIYRLTAKNGVGYSLSQCSYTMNADLVPQACTNPIITLDDIKPTQITVNWLDIPEASNGGDPVIFYELQWDTGSIGASYTPLNTYSSGMVVPKQYIHNPGYILSSGAAYNYRIRAKNGVDYSLLYCTLTINADQVPLACTSPIITEANIFPQKVIITWTNIDVAQNGGDAVIYYQLEWDQGNGGWENLNTYTSNMAVPLSYTHNTPSILNSGAAYVYRLTAQNGVGFSAVKCETTINADLVPQACRSPIIPVENIYPKEVKITWDQILESENGRDPVIFYLLEWDQGKNEWEPLNSYTPNMAIPTSLNHIPPSILNSGGDYVYRLTPKNGVAYSTFQCTTTIQADLVPQKCNPPIILEADVKPQQVTINWVTIDIADNGRDPIIFYLLEWDQGNGNWVTLNSYTANMAVPLKQVHTPAAILTSGMTIKYRLTAKNGVAYGAMSTETPVLCDAVPKKMDVPMVSMIRYNYISLYWTLLTTDDEIGRDPILYYRIEFFDRPCYANSAVACTTTFDAADGTWTDLTSTVTTITNSKTHTAATIFSAGKYFNYRVRAKNGVGWGEYSDILDVLTPVKPQFMNKPRCDYINPQAIKISWDQFTNTTTDFTDYQGRDIITYYTIEVDPDTGSWVTLNPTGSVISTFTHTSASTPFKNNTIFKYRVAATNGMGMGAYSEELLITTDTVPEEIQNLVMVSVEPKTIKVKWDDLITDTQIGRDSIKYYKLEYHDNQASTLVWTTLTSSSVAYVTQFTHTVASPFPANQDQSPHYVKYRVSASNGVGFGITTELSVLTDTYPRQMEKVYIADPTASLLDITWTQLSTDDIDTGRDPVIHYRVQWIVSSFTNNNWQTVNSYPDLTDNTKVTDSNSYWQDNTEFKFRVAAQNGVGLGVYSDFELVLTDDVPNRLKRMKVPVENPQTNATQIMIDWEDLTDPLDTGRDPVTYYRVYWDQGKNQWAEQNVPGNARVTTFLWNSGIKNGTTYKFKIRPQNLVGDSSSFDSPILSVIPSSPPDKMDKITITLGTNDVSVKLAWNYPQDNGDSVDEYIIEIRGKDGEFYTSLATCDGSSPVIVTNRYCFIFMDTLRNAPFNLVKGDRIVARGNSRNLKGFNASTSDAIDAQFPQLIEVEPNAPSAPLRGSNTDHNVLHITWPAITDNTVASGGATSKITSYQIQRNLGNSSVADPNDDVWMTLQGFSPNSTALSVQTGASIVGGTTYRTRVRAYNKFGWGAWSNVFEIISAKAPDATTWITTTNSSTNFFIKWQEPFNRGLSISRYYITIMKKGGNVAQASSFFASPDCDGSDPTINNTESCYIPMANLRGSPWFWGLNDKITVRIWAQTPMGQGNYYQMNSTTSGNNAAIQTQPQTPTTFVTNTLATTTDKQMKISWSALPSVDTWGGIQITSYEIYWMDPNNDYDLIYTDVPPFKFTYLHTKTDPLDFSVTPARHIVPGTLYKFKYRAINIHGIGSFSGESSIYASTLPDKLAPPVTSLLNTTVTIVWAPTPNDHAQPVTKYAIRFRASNGTYIEDTGCPGANPTVVSSLSCNMPMTKFTSAPFNLGIDTLIQVTLDAFNVMGWSGQSNPNTIGVLAKRLPQAAPSNLARGVNTGKNQIHLTWVGLFTNAQTGGQNVDYRIYYDRATSQVSWSILVTTTANATVYQELNSVIYKTGNLYNFKVQAWNDFGLGALNSSVFGIWTAIPPTGLAAPTSSLAYNSYTEEDEIIVIDWEPPIDNGGLAVSYQVDIRAKSMSFVAVSMMTECYENNNAVTDFKMPSIPTADLGTRCTLMITNLKSKYNLLVGDTVVARVTASHVVGSVTSDAGGTAILPIVPCFRTTFPRVVGGSNQNTMITCMDADDTGQIVIGGFTQDRNLLEGKTLAYSLPLAVYIAKGNFYAWAKYFQTTDTSNSMEFTSVSDITFRWDGEKVAIALDKINYDVSYMIVVLNKDGTLYGAYRENSQARGKIMAGGMIFDSSNMITVAVDFAPTGATNRRQAILNRFSVTQTAAGTFSTQFYLLGGANTANMISQSLALQRIRGDSSQFYLSALITDSGGIRRSILAKALFGTGVFQRYYVHAPGTDYNSDSSVAVIKRMSLEENDLTGQHFISACIMSQDNYRIHFGEFIFSSGTSSQTVLTPTSLAVYNTYNCLGTFSRVQGTLYFLYNYRNDANPVNHKLILGRVTVSTKRLDELNIVSHDGNNIYGGAKFVHMSRIYYFGRSNKIFNANTITDQPMNQGWINIFDPLEWPYSCNPTTQTFTIPATQIALDQVLVAQMDWKLTGLTSTSGYANSVTRTMRSIGTITGLNNLNLAEPLTNNTWCPIVTTGGGAPTITSPAIPNQVFQYNPDMSGSQTQSFQFNPITVSRFCPDTVIYNYTYLSATNKALPSFVTLKGENNSYVYDVSSTSHVGTYFVMLMSALGNNKSSSVIFRSQVVSPCINNPVAIPNAPIPIYDISEWSPKYFDLDWVVTNATKSCGSVYQIFELLNSTTGGPIDPNIYQIVNQSSGIQRIQIWTQSIPYAKLWTDLLVNSYLQGDFVASKVFTVNITNDCAPTVITPQVMPNWVYYTGRDSIDLTFVWSETIGKCGPISYTLRDYQISDPSSNNTLDPTIFTTPSVPGTNNTIKIFTADEAQVGTYRIRVFASLGVGGYKQSETIFVMQIIRDPCAYYGFTVPFIDDTTLWINQTDQIIHIPFFKMSDPAWICNFTYVFTTPLNSPLDSIFVKKEVVKQGTNPNITLETTDKTKVELSPYSIKVKGWPTRQPSSVAQSLTFRVYIAYFDKYDCIPGKYYNNITEVCEPCSSPCSQCKTNPNTCTWCIDDYIYVDSTNQCIPKTASCPTGVKDPFLSICRKCSEFCKTCDDFATCKTCIPNYSLANNKCYPPRSCPEGYTYNGNDCTKCPINCASCVSDTQCNYCMETFYLDTNTKQCVSTCPIGYYADVESRVCMVCAPQCKTCVNNNYTCTSCKDLVDGGVTTFTYLFGSACVDRCPYLQYYQNHANRSCDACDPQCKICVNAINDCIVCNDKSVISGRSCLNSCPMKSYITEIGTCFPCDNSCDNCTGAMNSMCSKCSDGNYLTQTTCDSKCNPPLYPDGPTRSCMLCPYYCNQCTMATDCQKCKTGYRQVPNSCEGEMFARLNGSVQLNMTMDPNLLSFNPTEITVELWFKIDNPLTSSVDVILGASPYKLRKKANVAQVQLSFDVLSYCDSFNLKANQWYHYAFAISEVTGTLNCYLTGERLSTGLNSVSLITADILAFRELTFGGSQELKPAENRLRGYVKEFRYWNVARSYFQINNFKDISLTTPPPEMLAYWRLDEYRTNNTAFRESVKGTLYTPTAPMTLPMIMELREIYLKICPEGTYGVFNESSNMAECIACHPNCKNCNGVTNTSCTDCTSQYRLIEAEQTCIPDGPCPNGYYSDVNRKCQPCHPYCETCEFTPTQCPKCKAKYFKQGFGCLDKCLRGLYGNYQTQTCDPNPLVTSMFPLDGTVYQYGSFIDLYATFEVLNGENKTTYTYGWIISQLSTDVDLAKDAAKPYFDTDITRVHLDNNILVPNKYYNITFYVWGKNAYYNGMAASMYNIIFIGIPPKNGRCVISPNQGIATVTTFQISSPGWYDGDEGGIAEYSFFYSLDKGESFVPIKTANSRLPSIQMIFDPVFTSIAAQIKCQAKSIKGFSASVETSFVLLKKSSANAKTELTKLNVSKVTDEKDAVKLSSQILQIAQDLGQIKPVDSKAFDSKITADKCTQATCSYSGQCIFNEFTKKYYCKCNPGYGGVNCTYKNATDLEIIRNQTLALCKVYNPMSLSGRNSYDFQFLDKVTTNLDLMTEDIHDAIFDILSVQVNKLADSRPNIGDNKDVTQYVNIISNMLEYQAHNNFLMNMTNGWKNVSDPAAKSQKMLDDLNKTVSLVNFIKNLTLKRLSYLQTEIKVQSRMISFRQVLQNSDSILSMPATDNIKKQQQTYVKISPSNFIGSSVTLTEKFIAEVTEFAMNPYQVNNTDNVAANILEVNLFNYNRLVDGGSVVNKTDVKNLPVPIEFSFPVSDNQNLTDFINAYNTLSNFKYSDVVKKDQMLRKSNLSCVYWDKINKYWSKEGCQLQGVDKNHIKCNCTHLSSFTILFATPKLTIDAPLLENTTISATGEVRRNISLSDIIKWPLDAYFANLKKLWQHNRPSFISFIVNPGFAVLILFWAMYFSSLIYYSGQDDLKRFKMTKQQNRDDLAEVNDNDVQNVDLVVKDLIVKDFLKDNGKFIKKEALRLKQPDIIHKPSRPPQIKIYEKLSKDEQKQYRKRARKKVFGMPSGLCARARRIYDITMKHNTKNPNAKMSFFNEVLKNNLWIGLIAKTSKIAPRHVRLLLMYFYSALHITLLTIIFAFELQEIISDQALFQVVVIAAALIPIVWVITIPVALILRMPMHLRQLMAGVRTKKINKAFQVVDQHMGWRYAIGYFICLTMFFIMTVVVLVFNIFYPHDYVMGWFFNVLLVYIFDLLVFTFMLAALQMVLIILSTKAKCFYNIWAAIEVFRYVKNLRG